VAEPDKLPRQSCLTFDKARDMLLRKGTRLVKMHGKDGPEWYVVPGGPVHHGAVSKLLKEPDMVAFDDGLFPGNSQTFRIERSVDSAADAKDG
jgi:hypothetical protein